MPSCIIRNTYNLRGLRYKKECSPQTYAYQDKTRAVRTSWWIQSVQENVFTPGWCCEAVHKHYHISLPGSVNLFMHKHLWSTNTWQSKGFKIQLCTKKQAPETIQAGNISTSRPCVKPRGENTRHVLLSRAEIPNSVCLPVICHWQLISQEETPALENIRGTQLCLTFLFI